jgi:hypothetical protein
VDGFDGFGYGTVGILALLLQGIPIALTLLAVITIVLCWERKWEPENPKRLFRIWHFLLYGAGGILLGVFVGLLLIWVVTGRADECELFKTYMSKPGNYSVEQVAEAKQRSETIKCPEFLENYEKVQVAALAWVGIVGLVAPSLGLWAGSRLMPRRRRYTE